jgi:cytoskeletal protein CcmA (bactofilin family)
MAIFGNNKDKPSKPSMATGNRKNQGQFNIVGEGTVFEGTLRADSDVNVSGRIVGKLIVDGRAVISKEGAVEGELRATNAAVGGTIQGEVYVEERLELESTANVDGSIQTDRLVVEEGAVFTGSCRMGDAIEKAALEDEEKAGDLSPGTKSSGSTSSSSTSSDESSAKSAGGDSGPSKTSSGSSTGSKGSDAAPAKKAAKTK